MEPFEPGGLSRRKRRAVALAAGAAIVIVVAGVAFLRGSSPSTTPSAGPLTANPSEATSAYVAYDFTSPSVGWALSFPMNDQGHFWVSRTIDGGKHWQTRLKGGRGMSGSSPLLVRFFDAKRGFISSGAVGELLHTTDGGAHWQSLSLPPESRISYVGFRDEKHGWLIALSANGQPGGVLRSPPAQPLDQQPHLYATDDAGESWRRLPDPPAGAYVFAFRRSSEAWLAGLSSGAPRVYRSVDGGLSWQRRDIPFPDGDVTMSSIGPWNTFLTLLPGQGVVASTFCTCPANSAFDSVSFDGGATWRFVPAKPNSGSSPRRTLAAYQDDVHWWFIDAKTLYRSSDAGQTWTKVSDQLPDWEFAPRSIDMNHAWAQVGGFGGYGLAITADAGLHWTRVTIPTPT